jgi:Mlc titration factor MtfA (ptsG expression regulator)
LRRYDAASLERLRGLVGAFLAEKAIEPAGGMVLTAATRQSIALQACVPILGLGLTWYQGWHSVIVYPGDFRVHHSWMDDDGVVHEGQEVRAGEAWEAGPVILSWAADDPDSTAVVVHEFAHKLDMRNGVANGMPPLHRGMDRGEWTRVFARAYDDFSARVDEGEPLPFDAYAATDPAEFFAVVSEVFLLEPDRLREAYPAVYEQLIAFYRWRPSLANR